MHTRSHTNSPDYRYHQALLANHADVISLKGASYRLKSHQPTPDTA